MSGADYLCNNWKVSVDGKGKNRSSSIKADSKYKYVGANIMGRYGYLGADATTGWDMRVWT